MAAQQKTILSLQNVSKCFGAVQAVDQLSIDVAEGEIFGFLGPNGAEKTTTISMICGLLAPDSGRICWDGRPVERTRQRDWIGVCPQTTVLWDKLTCLEQIAFVGEMYGLPTGQARRRAGELLEALNLTEKRYTLAAALSGGMKRRLNLALALVHDPLLLVLDEPEAGLDPQSRVMVRDYIRGWARARTDRTVIFTTHNMDEAERMVDRLVIIDHGMVLAAGTPLELKRRSGMGGVLEITLPADNHTEERICSVLADAIPPGARFHYLDGVVQVHCADAVGALSPFLSCLQQAGIVPGEVRLREDGLEDVFLALTGRRLRE